MSDRLFLETGDSLLDETGSNIVLETIFSQIVASPSVKCELVLIKELFTPTLGIRTESNLPLITEIGEALIQESMAADLLATSQCRAEKLDSNQFLMAAVAASNISNANLETHITCAGILSNLASVVSEISTQTTAQSALVAYVEFSPLLLTKINCESSVVSRSTASGDLSATIATVSLLAVTPDLQGAVTNGIRLHSALAAVPIINPALQASINLSTGFVAESTASGGVSTGISLEASALTNASATAQIATGIKAQAALNAETSAAADLRTEIDAFAAVMAVSNVQNARLTSIVELNADLNSSVNFLTEDGGFFLTEAGDRLVSVYEKSTLNAFLGFIVDLDSKIYCESKATVGLTAQIILSAAASAIHNAASELTTGLIFKADAISQSLTTASIRTSIQSAADFKSLSAFDSSLTTKLNAVAALLNVSTLAPTLSNSIQLAASPSVLAVVSASIQTRIAVQSSIFASPSLSSSLSVAKNLATTLNSNAVFVAEMKTAINALTALIGISNVSDASLTVYHVSPNYAPLDNLIYLAELQAYDPTTSSVITWRFASGQGYDNGGVFYPPRIEQPANLKRSIGGSSVGGRTSMSYGELTLANLDGGINAIADDYFDGRTLTLKRGNPSMPYNTFTTILVATVESVAMERERASIRLRDKAITLDQPFSTVKYAGTNTNGAGIEGTADDIKDQSKPRIFGRIALMPPVLVNTSKLIYQINAGAVDNVINVFDAGAYLTRSTDYTSQADMEGNDPASGTWRAWPGGGCIRLGSVPFGQVSVCVAEKWDYSQCTAAGLIQRILTEVGYTSANWLASDFVTLNQKNAGSLGIVVSDGETTAALLDRICQSVGAWWGFDSLGRFRVARLDAPSGTASATLTDNQIIELERQAADQLPVWQTTLKSDINYSKQDKKSLAGVVPANRANWFEQESRDQKVENASVKTQRLLAEDQTYDSLLNSISVANAESARRLALFSSRRDTVNLTLANPSEYYSSIDLGAVISVQTSKLGYDAGRLMTVTGVSLDYQANTMDITCWG